MKFKRDILELVWRKDGPGGLLSIGQGIADIAYDPVWRGALCSQNPRVLFDKWRRFEAFAHSRNRVGIDQKGENQALFRRHAVGGGTPTAPENLLICGLMIALLEAIGCRGLWCDMNAGGSAIRIRDNRRFWLPDDRHGLATGEWTIGWQTQSPTANAIRAEGELPETELPPVPDPLLAALVKRVVDLLMRDIARQWRAGELARELGLSTRSLQRRLGEAGLSFSRLVRLVRIHEACRLLRVGDMPLTVIGFCSGFSDSAHFSRDFRASVGLTPSEFRAVQHAPEMYGRRGVEQVAHPGRSGMSGKAADATATDRPDKTDPS